MKVCATFQRYQLIKPLIVPIGEPVQITFDAPLAAWDEIIAQDYAVLQDVFPDLPDYEVYALVEVWPESIADADLCPHCDNTGKIQYGYLVGYFCSCHYGREAMDKGWEIGA